MSYASRQSIFPNSAASSLRQPTLSSSNAQSQQSSALQSRIASKRQELENLKQLRDLSGALANQIGALETKLSTLRDGTEAVACVLANWDNVLRAISMASSMLACCFLCMDLANNLSSESATADCRRRPRKRRAPATCDPSPYTGTMEGSQRRKRDMKKSKFGEANIASFIYRPLPSPWRLSLRYLDAHSA